MTIFATNGAKFYIGTAIEDQSTDFDAADFTGQSWTEVKHTENLGSAGDTSSEISIDLIGQQRTKRLKGTRNAGTMEVVAGLDAGDPGQIALIAAERVIHDYAFRIVLNDAPAGGTPSERLFIAKVGSATEAYDAANNVVKFNASLWINSNIVKVNAAPSGG